LSFADSSFADVRRAHVEGNGDQPVENQSIIYADKRTEQVREKEKILGP
jgi:hypothetical protein